MTTSSTSPRSCAEAPVHRLTGTPVLAAFTGCPQGDMRDLATPPPPVPPGRALHRLHQVHGADVVVAGAARGVPGADAVVSMAGDDVLAVLVADCAPVVLGSPEGAHGAVHAGWRGLAAGVVARAVAAMRALGAGAVVAGLGPCIGACCYEFDDDEGAAAVAAATGGAVRGVTARGTPALDLGAAVRGALAREGVPLVVAVERCTACTPGYWSHRARGDAARQAALVWRR